MMRVLAIDAEVKARAEKVRQFALSRRQSSHDIMRRIKGDAEAPGEDPQYTLEIFDGWKIVYTIEQHPGGWYHHISVSILPRNPKAPWPHEAGVFEIFKLFSLGGLKDIAHAWPEDTPTRKALNFLFPFVEPAKDDSGT